MRSTSAKRFGFLENSGNLFLLVCLLVFAAFLRASFQMEERSSYLLPRGLAILGLAATSIQLILVVRRAPDGIEKTGGENHGVHVLASIAFTAAYFLLVPVLGFVLSTALAIAAFAYLTRFPRRKLVAALALIVPILLHLAFAGLLKAPLPSGALVPLPF